MKYKLYESVLNEAVGSNTARFVAEIEAKSLAEARDMVKKLYPNLHSYIINDGTTNFKSED
jgi:hypothetical protein